MDDELVDCPPIPPSTGYNNNIYAHIEQLDPGKIKSEEDIDSGLTVEEKVLVLHYRGAIKSTIQMITGLTRWEVQDILEENMATLKTEIDASPEAVKQKLLGYYFQMLDTATSKPKDQIDAKVMRAVVAVGREVAMITGIRSPVQHEIRSLSVNVDANKPMATRALDDPTMRALQLAMENRRIELESGQAGHDDLILNS